VRDRRHAPFVSYRRDVDARTLRIALIGDFDSEQAIHWATEAALFHAAAAMAITVQPRWVPTPALSSPGAVAGVLAGYDGVWGAPGSPFVSATAC